MFENKIAKTKNNIDVNTWGKYIANRLKLKYKPTNIIVKQILKIFYQTLYILQIYFFSIIKKKNILLTYQNLKKKLIKILEKAIMKKEEKF